MNRNSLSARIILVVVALVLPLNIYALYAARRSQEVIVEQAVTGMQNIANIYINDLEAKMETINNFILELEENNRNLAEIAAAEQWDSYYISAMGLRDVLNTHIASYDDADIYFFYSEDMQHGMLVEDAQNVTKARLEEVFLAGGENYHDRRWQIVTVDESKWLFHVNPWKGMYIGAAIQLDQLEAGIIGNLEYETAAAYVDQTADTDIGSHMLGVTHQCGKRNIYLHIQFEKNEVISGLPMLQKLGYRLSVLELLIIPIMLWVIRILVLNPLKTINSAVNRLKKNPDVRIEGKASTEDVIICIQDDGVGMPKALAENINQGIFDYPDGKNHMGLKNSYQRLKYLYGEKGRIKIVSECGRGMKVILRFPAEPEEQEQSRGTI